MSIVFHVNPATGRTGKCEATKKCRFGADIPHYKTAADAQKAYELTRAADTVPDGQSKAPKREKIDLATAPLKVPPRKRPVWGSACKNPKCSTVFHDIRDEAKVRKCFDAISSRLTAEDIELWEAEQKAYAKNFMVKQKKEASALLSAYMLLDKKQRTCRFEENVLRNALESDTPRYYTTEAKKMEAFLRRSRASNARRQPDSWAGAGSGSPFEPAIRNHKSFKNPPPAPGGLPQMELMAAKHGIKSPIAPSKTVTMEELKGYSLEKLKELEERERDLSTRVETREVKRMFRKVEIEEVKSLEYTKNYETFNEFVAYLPPESQKVYSVYQATIHNSRLNRPEVLEYLEKEFEKAKASEADQFLSEPSPLDEIKDLIRGNV